ncbi:MAG TPA: enoyl-CoA hydratase/isomerase family protein [Acidimicrobiales bacterium]|nr:enoyl-CoA hydratase/isomerase family protein [Acidimicrobiales bacterium]
MIDLETHDAVRVLRWRDGENRVHPDSMARFHDLLDELERTEGPLALVVTGEGKFFSNGLDLDRFGTAPEELGPTVEALHRLFGRLLLFPAYTVAALNGHAFAAGAMLASVFDHRVMRAERGYWCLPEVDLGLPLTEPMTAAVTARLPRRAADEAMLTGRRYAAAEALAAGIVDEAAPEDEVLARALSRATAMAPKDRAVLAEHKRMLFGGAAAACGWSG